MSSVDGFADLDRVFRELKKGVANRIARPGLMKAGRLVAKRVKASIPSRLKALRKAIGTKSLKTKHNSGVAGVKIGVSVGAGRKAKDRGQRGDRKGVGISGRNAHWWFLGTDHRWTGTKRVGGHKAGRKNQRINTGGRKRYTGRMPKQATSVSVIANQSRSEISSILKTEIQLGIEKEVARVAKKRNI